MKNQDHLAVYARKETGSLRLLLNRLHIQVNQCLKTTLIDQIGEGMKNKRMCLKRLIDMSKASEVSGLHKVCHCIPLSRECYVCIQVTSLY